MLGHHETNYASIYKLSWPFGPQTVEPQPSYFFIHVNKVENKNLQERY